MPKNTPDGRFIQVKIANGNHTRLKVKSALAGMTMTDFINSAIENYNPNQEQEKLK
jgi:predicted DNA binding CopG/RHH family protein